MENFTKVRVNASMLSNYQGRNVCLLGLAKNVDSNGMSFTLTSSDGQDTKVIMQEPLNEYVSGLTEVIGTVDPQNRIQCENYMVHPTECTETFDMDLYNKAVELMCRLPQHYITGVTEVKQ